MLDTAGIIGRMDLLKLIEENLLLLQECNERNCREWSLNLAESWQLDSGLGELVFTLPDHTQVRTLPQIIGSIDVRTHEWRWAWSNPSIDARLRGHAERLRAYGVEHGLLALTTDRWQASEQDGWNMTALALGLFQASGAYRAPAGNLHIFLTFSRL